LTAGSGAREPDGPVQVDMGKEQVLAIELDSMRYADVAHIASAARATDGLRH
jgi:hypothetical protein